MRFGPRRVTASFRALVIMELFGALECSRGYDYKAEHQRD